MPAMLENTETSAIHPVKAFLEWYGIAEKPAGQVGDLSNAFGAGLPSLGWIGAIIGFWRSWDASKKRKTTLLDLLDQTLQDVGLPADELESAKYFIQTSCIARDQFFQANTEQEFKDAIQYITANKADLNGEHGQKLLEVFTRLRFHQGGQGALDILRDEVSATPKTVLATVQSELRSIPADLLASFQTTLRDGFHTSPL
jgi:hypothetical protein